MMKKLFNTKLMVAPIAVLIILLGLSSCKKDIDPTPDTIQAPIATTNDVALQSISNENGCLVFDSVQQMEKIIGILLSSDKQTINSFYSRLQFTSLQSLFSEANEACSKITSKDEYSEVCSKYSSLFLFNTQDNEDLPPYLRVSKSWYAYVLNADGEVIINGSRVCFNDIKTVEDTPRYKIAHQTKADFETWQNHLYVDDGTHRMWIDAFAVDQAVYIRGSVQAKSFWGWNTYSDQYRILVSSTSFDSNWQTFRFSVREQWYNEGPAYGEIIIPVGTQFHQVTDTKVNGSMYFPIKETFTVYALDLGYENRGTLEMEFFALM